MSASVSIEHPKFTNTSKSHGICLSPVTDLNIRGSSGGFRYTYCTAYSPIHPMPSATQHCFAAATTATSACVFETYCISYRCPTSATTYSSVYAKVVRWWATASSTSAAIHDEVYWIIDPATTTLFASSGPSNAVEPKGD
jgi:hypothetical protein